MFGGSVYLPPYGWQGWVRLLVEKHVLLELGDDGAKQYNIQCVYMYVYIYIYIKKQHCSFYIVDSDS